MPGPDLLERIDRILAELAELRAAVADAEAAERRNSYTPSEVDDLADGNLLDTTSAAARFNYDRHTLARWCREEAIGVRRGGRWLVSIPRLQRHLNGGG